MGRERGGHYIRRDDLAVEVIVDSSCSSSYPYMPCFDRDALRFLDEVAARVDAGDLPYLRGVGRVYRALPAPAPPRSDATVAGDAPTGS